MQETGVALPAPSAGVAHHRQAPRQVAQVSDGYRLESATTAAHEVRAADSPAGHEEQGSRRGRTRACRLRVGHRARSRDVRLEGHCSVNSMRSQRARMEGRRISSASAESVTNHLVNSRLSKRHQMRWSIKGAHCLLQTRVELLDERLKNCFALDFLTSERLRCGDLHR